MMRRLESLEAWRAARKLAVLAYRLTLEPPLSRHFSLADQIRRAAPSVPASVSRDHTEDIGQHVTVYCLGADVIDHPFREVSGVPDDAGPVLDGITPSVGAYRGTIPTWTVCAWVYPVVEIPMLPFPVVAST